MDTQGKYLHKRPSGSYAELNDIAHNILKSFFNDYNLDDSHAMLWEMIRQSFYTKSAILNSIERSDLICFYERLHEIILAGSMINDYHQANRIGMESI